MLVIEGGEGAGYVVQMLHVVGEDGLIVIPNGNVTREQVAAILTRYLEYLEISIAVTMECRTFPDSDQISNWADAAVQMMNKLGIINGRPGCNIDPQGDAARAEVATMLMRFIAVIASAEAAEA